MKLIRSALIFSAGYVLGARAGRKRYEQIKELAGHLWDSTPLRAGREAMGHASAAGFTKATQTATAAARNAAQAMKDKFASAEENLDDDVIVVDPLE